MTDGKFVIGFIGMGMGTMESLVGVPFPLFTTKLFKYVVFFVLCKAVEKRDRDNLCTGFMDRIDNPPPGVWHKWNL
jgi:hypothetical protein